jgi:hypothetical protein
MADEPKRPIVTRRALPLFAVVGLLLVDAVLFSSSQFLWFEFNYHKGWTSLIAVIVAIS